MDPEQLLQLVTDVGDSVGDVVLLFSLIIMLLLVASGVLLYRKIHRLERMLRK